MKSNMNYLKYLVAGVTAGGMLTFAACDVEKTEEGEMPTVDVDVEGDAGNLPEYDVEGPDVEAGTKTETVQVPKVVMVEEEVEVPYVDVSLPDDDSNTVADRRLDVELEAPTPAWEVAISEIYRNGEEIIVLAQLNKTQGENEMTAQVETPIRDTVMIKAPEGADVSTYVMGSEAREDQFDTDAEFIRSKQEISSELGNAQRIYQRSNQG